MEEVVNMEKEDSFTEQVYCFRKLPGLSQIVKELAEVRYERRKFSTASMLPLKMRKNIIDAYVKELNESNKLYVMKHMDNFTLWLDDQVSLTTNRELARGVYVREEGGWDEQAEVIPNEEGSWNFDRSGRWKGMKSSSGNEGEQYRRYSAGIAPGDGRRCRTVEGSTGERGNHEDVGEAESMVVAEAAVLDTIEFTEATQNDDASVLTLRTAFTGCSGISRKTKSSQQTAKRNHMRYEIRDYVIKQQNGKKVIKQTVEMFNKKFVCRFVEGKCLVTREKHRTDNFVQSQIVGCSCGKEGSIFKFVHHSKDDVEEDELKRRWFITKAFCGKDNRDLVCNHFMVVNDITNASVGEATAEAAFAMAMLPQQVAEAAESKTAARVSVGGRLLNIRTLSAEPDTENADIVIASGSTTIIQSKGGEEAGVEMEMCKGGAPSVRGVNDWKEASVSMTAPWALDTGRSMNGSILAAEDGSENGGIVSGSGSITMMHSKGGGNAGVEMQMRAAMAESLSTQVTTVPLRTEVENSDRERSEKETDVTVGYKRKVNLGKEDSTGMKGSVTSGKKRLKTTEKQKPVSKEIGSAVTPIGAVTGTVTAVVGRATAVGVTAGARRNEDNVVDCMRNGNLFIETAKVVESNRGGEKMESRCGKESRSRNVAGSKEAKKPGEGKATHTLLTSETQKAPLRTDRGTANQKMETAKVVESNRGGEKMESRYRKESRSRNVAGSKEAKKPGEGKATHTLLTSETQKAPLRTERGTANQTMGAVTEAGGGKDGNSTEVGTVVTTSKKDGVVRFVVEPVPLGGSNATESISCAPAVLVSVNNKSSSGGCMMTIHIEDDADSKIIESYSLLELQEFAMKRVTPTMFLEVFETNFINSYVVCFESVWEVTSEYNPAVWTAFTRDSREDIQEYKALKERNTKTEESAVNTVDWILYNHQRSEVEEGGEEVGEEKCSAFRTEHELMLTEDVHEVLKKVPSPSLLTKLYRMLLPLCVQIVCENSSNGVEKYIVSEFCLEASLFDIWLKHTGTQQKALQILFRIATDLPNYHNHDRNIRFPCLAYHAVVFSTLVRNQYQTVQNVILETLRRCKCTFIQNRHRVETGKKIQFEDIIIVERFAKCFKKKEGDDHDDDEKEVEKEDEGYDDNNGSVNGVETTIDYKQYRRRIYRLREMILEDYVNGKKLNYACREGCAVIPVEEVPTWNEFDRLKNQYGDANWTFPRYYIPTVSRPAFSKIHAFDGQPELLQELHDVFFTEQGCLNAETVRNVLKIPKHYYITFSGETDRRWQIPIALNSDAETTYSKVKRILQACKLLDSRKEEIAEIVVLVGGSATQRIHTDVGRQQTIYEGERRAEEKLDYNSTAGWEVHRLYYNREIADRFAPSTILIGLGATSKKVRIGVQKNQVEWISKCENYCRIINGNVDDVFEIVQRTRTAYVIECNVGCRFTGDFTHCGAKNHESGTEDAVNHRRLFAWLGNVRGKILYEEHENRSNTVLPKFNEFGRLDNLSRLFVSTKLIRSEIVIPTNSVSYDYCRN